MSDADGDVAADDSTEILADSVGYADLAERRSLHQSRSMESGREQPEGEACRLKRGRRRVAMSNEAAAVARARGPAASADRLMESGHDRQEGDACTICFLLIELL